LKLALNTITLTKDLHSRQILSLTLWEVHALDVIFIPGQSMRIQYVKYTVKTSSETILSGVGTAYPSGAPAIVF
jgi:hypothetical protein